MILWFRLSIAWAIGAAVFCLVSLMMRWGSDIVSIACLAINLVCVAVNVRNYRRLRKAGK